MADAEFSFSTVRGYICQNLVDVFLPKYLSRYAHQSFDHDYLDLRYAGSESNMADGSSK